MDPAPDRREPLARFALRTSLFALALRILLFVTLAPFVVIAVVDPGALTLVALVLSVGFSRLMWTESTTFTVPERHEELLVFADSIELASPSGARSVFPFEEIEIAIRFTLSPVLRLSARGRTRALSYGVFHSRKAFLAAIEAIQAARSGAPIASPPPDAADPYLARVDEELRRRGDD